MGKYLSVAGMILVGALLFVQPSRADNFVTYELAGHGLDITFSLPQTLTPASVQFGTINLQNVSGSWGKGGTYNFATLQLGPSGWNNFTNYWAFGSQTHSIAFFAPGLFTWNSDGTVTLNPGTFSIGTYLTFTGGPFDYKLTAVQHTDDSTGVPEPASVVLLGAGGLALGALRRRKSS